jgi:hypothetical protein
MQYTHTLTLTLPASMLPIAQAISRALDPDVGGYASWTEAGDTITTTTPCTEAFAAQAQAMLADPALLHGAVVADYAARWADMTPPTLAECEQFCNEVTL